MRRAHLTIFVLPVLLAACGAAERESPAKPEAAAQARAPVGGEQPAPEPVLAPATTAPPPAPGPARRGAVLSVYVRGPSPSPEVVPGARSYEAEIVVINTGDQPAEMEGARARFEAWRGDRRIECGATDLEGPTALGPGQAHVYRASAGCDLAPDAEYEVRAYLDFGADSGALHREIHHVGVRPVHVGE